MRWRKLSNCDAYGLNTFERMICLFGARLASAQAWSERVGFLPSESVPESGVGSSYERREKVRVKRRRMPEHVRNGLNPISLQASPLRN